MKTIKNLIDELAENIERRKRNNGDTFYCLKDNSPEWMTDVIFKAHGDRMPDDDVYNRIYDIVNHISGYENIETLEDAQDALNEIEPDIYTSDLTAWLHSRNDNIFYLTEVLEEAGAKDGFQLLSQAQYKYIMEIGESLLDSLNEITENQEDEDE